MKWILNADWRRLHILFKKLKIFGFCSVNSLCLHTDEFNPHNCISRHLKFLWDTIKVREGRLLGYKKMLCINIEGKRKQQIHTPAESSRDATINIQGRMLTKRLLSSGSNIRQSHVCLRVYLQLCFIPKTIHHSGRLRQCCR